ncbi:MAG: ABC transporter substrate-binding protein [Candidatus Nanoarchaeia archaeon]
MKYTIVILLVFLAACSSSEINIGVIAAQTGPIASISVPSQHAIELALDDWNGDPSHTKINVIFEDNKGKPVDSANAFHKLQIDGVAAIITDISSTTLTAAPLADAQEMHVVAYISTSPSVLGSGDYVYRTSPMNLEGMSLVSDHMLDSGQTRIVTLTEHLDYTLALSEVFKEGADGLTIVAAEEFAANDDVKSTLLKLTKHNPDAIMIFSHAPYSGIYVAKQIKELGIDIPVYGSETMGSDMAVEIDASTLEGLMVGSPVYDLERMPELQKKYNAKFNDKIFDWLYVATAYDAAMVLFDAIDEVGTDGAAIKQYLDDVENVNGYSGFNSFDDQGDVAEGKYGLFKVVNGTKVIVSQQTT